MTFRIPPLWPGPRIPMYPTPGLLECKKRISCPFSTARAWVLRTRPRVCTNRERNKEDGSVTTCTLSANQPGALLIGGDEIACLDVGRALTQAAHRLVRLHPASGVSLLPWMKEVVHALSFGHKGWIMSRIPSPGLCSVRVGAFEI